MITVLWGLIVLVCSIALLAVELVVLVLTALVGGLRWVVHFLYHRLMEGGDRADENVEVIEDAEVVETLAGQGSGRRSR